MTRERYIAAQRELDAIGRDIDAVERERKASDVAHKAKLTQLQQRMQALRTELAGELPS